MKSFKQILETVYRPKGGDEQAFLDKHVVDLQAHPVANEFQFKAAKTPKAKRKADYDEKEDEKVYEAAEVHTKRADKEPVIVRSTDPKTGESKAKTVMRRAGEIKIGEEVELDEAFKKGDIVKPTKGPHKGHPHEVIHDFGDGNYNIKPKGLNPKQIRYSMGAAKAHKSDLVKEEVELEESITKMSDARLKFHATKNVPHGSYTRKEVEDEHKRRVKTGGVSYASVKPSLNEEADLDEKVKNPYAVGMAAAMKATGDTPPLKKSTIVKGHEIAKSIQKEAMDPVGQADADINNDGKVDGSDKYLHARRKAIGKALRKEEVELDEATFSMDIDGNYKKKVALGALNAGLKINFKQHGGATEMILMGDKDKITKFLKARKVPSTEIDNGFVKEETEELDEISKKTLGSYVTKASYDAAKHAARYGSGNKPGSFVKAHQRLAGIKKASDKLAKEEVEQIDELSPNTLHSYIKKAAGNMAGNAAVAAAQASSSMKKSSPDVKRNIANRMKGITGASGRLADKANMAEEAELDEVSDKKLDAYRQKAFADQPAGDDGSDKYRKRKFGRDLAFDKQTGRAKVLATKESVDLDEAFKIGAMKLKDGSSVTLSREDVDALNDLSKLLNSTNQSKMQDQVTSSKKEFNQILAFAKEAVQHG